MGDELEKFVKENRTSFDTEMPDEQVWARIHRQVHRKRPVELFWRIAAVLLLMSTVYLAVDRNIKNRSTEEVTEQGTEFGQVERYYSTLIAEKKAEIARFDRGNLKRSFLVEIERLDQLYDELKDTYKNQHAGDILVDAMISNLKLRIDILNQQLKILKKLNESENENEPVTTI